MENKISVLKNAGIIAGWIASFIIVWGLLFGLTQEMRAQILKESVNRTLKELQDPRKLDQIIPAKVLPKNMGSLGTWYTQAGSEERLCVFSIMNDGIPVPCLASLSEEGTVKELLPLNAAARQIIRNLSPETLALYVNRMEAGAALERQEMVQIAYREPVVIEPKQEEPAVREQIAADITVELERLGISDTKVTVVEEGISINLDNIQFVSSSARMLPGEERKLAQISAILMQYRSRDILIGGHTAQAGNTAGDVELSESRARVVADYLIQNKIRDASQIEVRGYGATRPVADNNTEEGRQKNRRVEIVLR
ncbi:MAG: OmpA family protein [Spirochaetaceae bacterium]|nr:OmpA family protein [Spirochaetaceae bacterium]